MKKLFRFFGKLLLWFFILSAGGVGIFRFVPVYVTPLMVIRAVQSVAEGEKPRIKHRWVSFHSASEDQRFYSHKGFDRIEIRKAIDENKTRKKARGASTITQQTAKNLFLWPRSSWFRKGLEAYFTVLLELLWPKDRILEVYLNCMETGKGVYGAEAVAREHFSTSAAKLSESQSALIAATLPNPLKFSSKAPSPYIKQRQAHILRQMRTVQLQSDSSKR